VTASEFQTNPPLPSPEAGCDIVPDPRTRWVSPALVLAALLLWLLTLLTL
jgi:hypothetical protein